MVTILSTSSGTFLFRLPKIGVFPVDIDNTLEVLLLLDNVLDLEWRLPLLKLNFFFAEDKAPPACLSRVEILFIVSDFVPEEFSLLYFVLFLAEVEIKEAGGCLDTWGSTAWAAASKAAEVEV